MRIKGLDGIKKVYFIGIGGISMSALAQFLHDCGYQVCGSDEVKGEQTEKLRFQGICVYVGADENREALRQADLIVYTDAIADTHPERLAAKFARKKVYSRVELLAVICAEFPNVIAIAGSHGKTTCTSMCAHIFMGLRVPFTAHIGGEDVTLGNYYGAGEEYFLTEACEYKKNLLRLPKKVGILLNIDKDHMECYDGEEDLVGCFQQYCRQAERAFVCADDERCRRLGDFHTFGIVSPLADYRAVDLRANGERYAFTVEEYGKVLCRVRLNAIGRCNVYNALAAFAAARSFGFDGETLARGLESFTAVKRRFEKIGELRGASFICDYAHHPREILSTVATAKGLTKKNLYVVFQPHTYSRTKLLMSEFTEALKTVENLMIYKTYPARESYDAEGSGERLAEAVGSLYADGIYALKTWLKTTVRENDVVLFLGAGDIYYTAQFLLKELQ